MTITARIPGYTIVYRNRDTDNARQFEGPYQSDEEALTAGALLSLSCLDTQGLVIVRAPDGRELMRYEGRSPVEQAR